MKSDRIGQKPSMTSEQKGVFQSMLRRFGGWLHSRQPEDDFIDYFVNTVEPKLKWLKGYRNRLREPLQLCQEYSRSIVAGIPGPICLERSGFSDDPIIKAAFSKPDQIRDLLTRTERATSHSTLSGTERIGLLTMRSTEKTIFGRKKFGNMIMGDTAMRAITFTDHNLVGLAATHANSIKALEKYCFEIITEATARELSEVRTRLVDLRKRREWLRATKKMFGSRKGAMGCVFVPFDPEKHKKQKKLEQMLMETENELAAASSESETPENWLAIIGEFLSRPEDILSMRLVSLRLDWSNVLTDNPDEDANTITLATFTLADEMQREGILVTYDQV